MTTTLTTPAALAAHHGWRRVLAVGAHPDDLDFGAAATLAGFRAAGLHIELCIVTDGDAGGFDSEGPEAMTARRHAEQRAAAAVVGAAEVHFLGERDGHLEPDHGVRRKLVALMRRVRPDVVLSTHPERDWERMQAAHPDHLACGEAGGSENARTVFSDGARVQQVVGESAADAAGLKEGDVITAVGDRAVIDSESLTAVVREHRVGDSVDVTYLRDGAEQTTEVTFTEDTRS